jgi:hypothetical protein
MKIHHLSISWAISRGRDTYGYNICRLDDNVTKHRFRCLGGGYDMIGTVLGEWFEATYQDKLKDLVTSIEMVDAGYAAKGYKKSVKGLYGLTERPDGTVILEGSCGQSSMQTIIEACGFTVGRDGNKKGHTVGFFVRKKNQE